MTHQEITRKKIHSSPPLSTQNTNNVQVKLPTINLPTFSKQYEDWLPFLDTFTALIDKNESLTEIQKLHYLKSARKGEAADTIKSIGLRPPTTA